MNREILQQIKVWNDAHRSVPNYQAIYDYVSARAGEGEIVTPEQIGIDKRNFCFDTLYLLPLPGMTKQFVIYSMESATGEMDVELIS